MIDLAKFRIFNDDSKLSTNSRVPIEFCCYDEFAKFTYLPHNLGPTAYEFVS